MDALQVDGTCRRFALYMAEDGTALLGDLVEGLPAAARNVFGRVTAGEAVQLDHPLLAGRWPEILRDVDESGYAVV